MASHDLPVLSQESQATAICMAMLVRNAMEDFHVEHLSDDQMGKLNPIIRNAIVRSSHSSVSPGAIPGRTREAPAGSAGAGRQPRCATSC